MKLLIVFLCLACSFVFGQENSFVNIKGYAPAYIGQKIQVKEIEDYISMHTSTIASSTINSDSTFTMTFSIAETQKVLLTIENNQSFLYIQPGGNYTIYFPQKDKRTPYRPAGNQVEVTFYDLDSNDINYKVLGFNRWMDNFLALNYADALRNPVLFNKNLDSFKLATEKYYLKDTGQYIFDYVRFTIANTIDNIQQAANRNRYEKHDFYIKHQPVLYRNDAYMDYFKKFYKGMMTTIPMEVNNRVYLGLLKSSPTVIMNALGLEFTLINMRIREMVMVQLLSELYYSPEYPQTNILTVLDSVKSNALFSANKLIATNIINRLTEVVNGGKAPQFALETLKGEKKGLINYKGSYLYLHFYDPTSEKNKIELPILKNLYQKYNKEVTFLTICKESDYRKNKNNIDQLDWDVAIVPDENSIFNNYRVVSNPYYILIDSYSYIVQAPALGPQPNNLYETIDKVFFELQKALNQEKH
ncbi:MAG: redoxin domain-containing protein [Crocinitomicaceae bacterium]|nr:redoxin domain-containing protein [Crocinitomicaceae bacterium]